MNLKTIEEAFVTNSIPKIIGLVCALCGLIGLSFWGLVPQNITNKIEILLILELICLLIISLTIFVPWIIHLKREIKEKPDFSKFIHDPQKACWINKETGVRICEACKVEGKLVLLSQFNSGWKCPIHLNIVDYHSYPSSDRYEW